MKADPKLTRVVRSWLREDQHEDADRVLFTVLEQLETTPQRRAGRLARRFPLMNNTTVRYGLAAAAVLVIALIGANLLPGVNIGGSPEATSSPTAASTPAATATPAPSLAGRVDAVPAGPLLAGTYTYYDVEGKGFDVSFTVPAGWSWNDWYLTKDAPDAPDGIGIGFWTGDLAVYADPCDWSDQASVLPSRTVEDLMAALAAQPMRNATVPVDRPAPQAGADALAGMVVQLTVPADLDIAECDDGKFYSWSGRYHQGPGQHDLVWAIDVGDEQLIIDAGSFPATSDADRAEMEAVLDSITITSPGS